MAHRRKLSRARSTPAQRHEKAGRAKHRKHDPTIRKAVRDVRPLDRRPFPVED